MNKLKIFIPIIIFIMFIPLMVNSKDKLTITYDSNDGTGRKKVVELEKGDSYTTSGNDIFPNEINNNNPMNDKILTGWNSNSDYTGYSFSKSTTYKYNENSSYETKSYNYLNDSSEITLYAKWEKRKDIKAINDSTTVTGDGVIEKENGEYEIEKYTDFEISFHFYENAYFQLDQLSFYELPTFFTSLFTEEQKKVFAKETDLPIKIYSSAGTDIFNGKFYVKNDTLFVDFIRDGTIEAQRFFAATNVKFRITYNIKYNEEKRNSHVFHSVSLSLVLNGVEESNTIIYPKGKIITKYIDVDSNEIIAPDYVKTDIIGEIYDTKEKNFDGYQLIESPNFDKYEFDEEDQVIYYKYKKNDNNKNNNNNKKELINNPMTGTEMFIIISIILLTVTIIPYLLIRKNKYIIMK